MDNFYLYNIKLILLGFSETACVSGRVHEKKIALLLRRVI